jgi:putative lipoprotein
MHSLTSIALAVSAVCVGGSAMADFKTLEGSATYRQRIALQPGAVLEVELRDVSRADAPAPVLSAVAVRPNKQVPIPFKLIYDDAMIDQRHTYAVSARIRVNDKIVFRSTSAHLVLTRDNPDQVEVMMEMMSATSEAADAGKLFGVTWIAENIGGGGVIDKARSTITFAAGGVVNGSGGCNTFSGTAKVDGNRIEIGPLAATQKACIPALTDQEQKFFKALANAHLFEIDERTQKLILKDESGAPLATLGPSTGRGG